MTMAKSNAEKTGTAGVRTSCENVLEVSDLVVQYILEDETVEAVNGISFSLQAGRTIGLVGETGAGKNVDGAGHIESRARPARRD